MPTYVGVPHGDDSFKPLPMRTRHLLTLVSGEELQINKSTCYGSVNDEVRIHSKRLKKLTCFICFPFFLYVLDLPLLLAR